MCIPLLLYTVVWILPKCHTQEPPPVPPTVPNIVTTPLATTKIPDVPTEGPKRDLIEELLQDVDPGLEEEHKTEYEGYDGWYNNAAHPELGSVDSPLIRILPTSYADGVYKPIESDGKQRPNPFLVSNSIMSGNPGNTSKTGKTALLVFFGQQVVEEILDAQRGGCPPEYYNIPIPEGHNFAEETGHKEMPLLRTRYSVQTGNSPNNPRQQLNEITPWIDGGLTYGVSKAWADTLRSFKDGELASTLNGRYPAINEERLPMANPPPPRDHTLKPVSRFYKLGNPRGNENPFLLSFGVLWFRWHNAIAKGLKNINASWSDEFIFNEARKWTIATHQHIVVNEWLPAWLGDPLKSYEGYDSSIDPGISHVFQSAAMRFGHTLVVSGVQKRSKAPDCDTSSGSVKAGGHRIRTCNSFWNPQESLNDEDDLEELLMGMASQPAEREDNVIVEDLRGRVFGPLEFSRRDLMAVNIQRGRDHGLPDYRTARHFMLPKEDRIEGWEDIENITSVVRETDPQVIERLKELYTLDNIDIWAGGLLETTDRPGKLFSKIIEDQFRRIRDGDRFWFENTRNKLFTEAQTKRIKRLSIYDIILKVTSISEGDIQKNPFQLPSDQNTGLNMKCRDKMKKYQGQSGIVYYSLPPFEPSGEFENCTVAKTFDYFKGSEISYALSFFFLGAFIVGCVLVLYILAQRRERMVTQQRKAMKKEKRKTLNKDMILSNEWIGKKQKSRQVLIHFDGEKKCITVHLLSQQKVRSIDLKHVETVELQVGATSRKLQVETFTILLRVAREYDLVLKFEDQEERNYFIGKLEEFLGLIGVGRQRRETAVQQLLNDAITKAHRQKQLEKFFRVVFAQAFGIAHDQDELLKLDAAQAKEIINTELTPHEFAEALSTQPESAFVQQMFNLVDKDNNGYISFREFLDMLIIFAKGTPEDKVKLMFDMYDIDHSGKLSKKEFTKMIRSMLELANQSLSSEQLFQLVNSMFREADLQNKEELTFDDFVRLLSDHRDELGYLQLNFDVEGIQTAPPNASRQSALHKAHGTIYRVYSYFGPAEDTAPRERRKDTTQVKVETKQERYQKEESLQRFHAIVRYIENYRLHIFWLILYTLTVIGIFAERAYYYSVEREHGGLRRIAGYGVTVTRGAASVMMFTYSTILFTMCRNTITFLRETFLHRFVPFDAAVSFHKYIAAIALVFSIIHTVGHAVNFYHISTQTANDLTCLFRDFYHATHELPKFHYWCFQTITGLTGVFLVMVLAIMYVFAIQFARRQVFHAFWLTHNLYPVLYILMIMHGLGRLVQDPLFYYFFLGPCIIFTLDKLVSISRKKVEIAVMHAELLPSDVTKLVFKRPPNFEYKSGQWIRIASPLLNENEYHPFTLSSAPHESNLSLHIRAIGPWTMNIRRMYDPNIIGQHAYPKVYLDGPYGEGHQDWFRFEVSVLVGGGIGVTPFASILKDVAFKSSSKTQIPCRKIYFLWVTRTQKHFEWLIDIIRGVEENDKQGLVTVHIFITQFYQKFDLRTTMLYICERHFQRICNRSLFTGLQSVTHFGRPNFNVFLNSLQQEHPDVTKIGVFSCGPLPMTRSIQQTCEYLNKKDGAAFVHHYENF